jgi:hypothetical protein
MPFALPKEIAVWIQALARKQPLNEKPRGSGKAGKGTGRVVMVRLKVQSEQDDPTHPVEHVVEL